MKKPRKDTLLALIPFGLTLVFIVLMMTKSTFFDWVFERHKNQWSWYIRPLFLIPFCYFAFHQNWLGIGVTVLCLFTSMFWFATPENVSKEVELFLRFEKDWLLNEWDLKKILLILLVPLSFVMLGFALWKRSKMMGLTVIVLMAFGKLVWSIYNAGENGKSIVMPAMVGLVVCVLLLLFGFRRIAKK